MNTTDAVTSFDFDRFRADTEEQSQPTAVCFVAALGPDHGTPEDVAQILPRIDHTSILMLNHACLAELGPDENWYMEHALHEDANIVLFADGSILHFEYKGSVHDETLELGRPIDFDAELHHTEGLQRVSASADHLERHPDAGEWLRSLAKWDGFGPLLTDVSRRIDETRDPEVDPASIGTQAGFTAADLDRLHEIADICWRAMGLAAHCDLEIGAAETKKHRPSVVISTHLGDLWLDKAQLAYTKLLADALDLSPYWGVEHQHIDPSSNRRSAYYQKSIILYSDKSKAADASNHARIIAQGQLLALIEARGIDISQAREILDIDPETYLPEGDPSTWDSLIPF